MSNGIVITPVVLTYEHVDAAGSGPGDIPSNIEAGTYFSAPFDVQDVDTAVYLTTDPELNFTAAARVEMLGGGLAGEGGWISTGAFTATVYGQERTVTHVLLLRRTGPAGLVWSTGMLFEGGCAVTSGPEAAEVLARLRG